MKNLHNSNKPSTFALVGRTFYKPGNLGYEKHIQDWFHLIKKEK